MASNKKAISLADKNNVSWSLDSIEFYPSNFTYGKNKNLTLENGLGADYILEGQKDQPFSFEHIFGEDEYEKLMSLFSLDKPVNIKRTVKVKGVSKVLILKDCNISNVNVTEDANSTGRMTVDGIVSEMLIG